MHKEIDRELALTELIRSVAQIETALAHILYAEGKRLHAFFDNPTPTPEETNHCCETSNDVLNNIYKIETQLQHRLDLFFNH